MLDLIIILFMFFLESVNPEVNGFNSVPVSSVLQHALKKAQWKLVNKSSTLYHPNFWQFSKLQGN